MLKSYRSRLFVAFVLVASTSLALFLGLTMSQLVESYRRTQIDGLLVRLKLWSYSLDFVTEPLSPQTQEALHQASGELGVALVVTYADERPRFFAADGYALSDAEITKLKSILDEELPQRRPTTLQLGDLAVVAFPVALDGQTPVLLTAVAPTASLEAGWKRLAGPTLYATLLGLAVALLLTILLARGIARPVTRLTAAAGRMAQGIYDDPPLSAGDDELGRLTDAFNTMREQVRLVQRSQRDFLAGISHDLKTPLSIVQGYVSALADGTAGDEATRQRALSGIQRETERLTRLVASLLALARLESGLVPFEPVALDLSGLVRGTLADLAPQAKARGVRLADELPASLPTIEADPAQIERVVINLLDNALRFTPDGGLVTVGGGLEPGGGVRLWAQDTGPGIPPEALPHIFDRFYQADQPWPTGRSGSGPSSQLRTGLGLAIAREIVNRHGGRIEVESLVGQGTRFTITLPTSPC